MLFWNKIIQDVIKKNCNLIVILIIGLQFLFSNTKYIINFGIISKIS